MRLPEQIAVGTAGLLPAAIAYAVVAIRRPRDLDLTTAFTVTGAFILSCAVIPFVWFAFERGVLSPDQLLWLGPVAVALILPNLFLVIFFSLLTLVFWKVSIARYVFAFWSLVAQVLYLVNLALHLQGIDLMGVR
jgi:hypothetical protein